MEEEYSRRKQQRPPAASKKTIAVVILSLFLNTLALGLLLFLNVQASSKQEEKFNNIEKQISQLDRAQETNDHSIVTDSTEHNVPARESSTQVTSAIESNSTEKSSAESIHTTPSSEVPERSTEPTTPPAATSYVVQSGDTLSVIAEKNKIPLQELMQKNNLNDSTVYIGQVLSLQ
ncbi:LysM peptidoglycan-binding domain-containing protein [Enterococcus rotai]|uniref:LysM peptidoglycan-binding domain-containing protein n=1 Tax=Enterococcus rotai TaxID=118060 RepID=UPI0035C746FB